jgi:S1-C subfamily serine protease
MEQENIPNVTIQTGKKRRQGWGIFMLATIAFSMFFGAIFGLMSFAIAQKMFPKISQKFPSFFQSENQNSEIIKQQVIQEDSAIINVVEKSSPAVVSIVISKDISQNQNFFSNPFNFFNFPDLPNIPNGNGGQNGMEKQKVGSGSGFFATSDGLIITNKHVVSDLAAEYTVLTNDNQEHKASVLARDPVNDIAIIKIDGSNYPTLNLGNSDALKIGQTVIAIGNSLGEFNNTVSRGIVSGLGRDVTAGSGSGRAVEAERLTGIIQTDAAINPGNSGGPLLDINGNVIGVNVAIVQGAQNVGFALPSNQIKRIVDQVKTTGKLVTPYLGIRYIPIDKTVQIANNLAFDYGVVVKSGQQPSDFAVIPGSPADKAGIMENDIILEIDGKKIDENNPLANLIAEHNVGDEVSLRVWHRGEEKNIKVILEARNPQ